MDTETNMPWPFRMFPEPDNEWMININAMKALASVREELPAKSSPIIQKPDVKIEAMADQ